MSISTLANMKSSREGTSGDSPAAGNAAKSISDGLTAIAAYIPSEVIGVYIAVLAIVTRTSTSAAAPEGPNIANEMVVPLVPIWGFAAFLVGTVLSVWLAYALRAQGSGQKVLWSPRRWPYWEAVSASLAFTVWSAVLPGSAFRHWSWFSVDVATIALLVISLLLPRVGDLVNKRHAGSRRGAAPVDTAH